MNAKPFADLKPRPARHRMSWRASPAIRAWNELDVHTKDACLNKLDSGMTNAEWREWMRQNHQINFRTDLECLRAREIFNREVILIKASDRADQFEKFLVEKIPDLKPEEVRERVLLFIALQNAGTDNKIAISALKACIAEDTFRLDRDKFQHLKEQAAKADKTEEVLDAELSNDERALKIAQIYGRA